MPDIYGRAGNDFQGAFAADAARINFAGATPGDGAGFLGVGLVTQQVQLQYSQAISRIYEVGTNFTYLVMGRTQGQISLSRVLGPRPVQLAFYTKFGNGCNAAGNNLNFEADTGCPQGDQANPGAQGGLVGTYKFGVHNCVITQLSIAVGAQDMVINESLTMMFVSLTGDQVR